MNRLKELREARNWTMREAASALGYKYMTYVNYEKEERQMYPEQLIRIADFYGVSIDYLLCQDERVIRSPLDAKYNELDETSKKVVDAVLDIEREREPVVVDFAKTKVIPLFSAAAGPGSPTSQAGFDDFEVPADSKAQFAVRISGDSMEPYLHDGEVVLCKKKRPEDFEMAVIMVNGDILVKQYVEDGYGNIYLRSTNRERKNLDVDLWASGQDNVRGFGTVIFRKIPPVKQ